jgi:hypothetical protein
VGHFAARRHAPSSLHGKPLEIEAMRPHAGALFHSMYGAPLHVDSRFFNEPISI